jgi:hypothetical protein
MARSAHLCIITCVRIELKIMIYGVMESVETDHRRLPVRCTARKVWLSDFLTLGVHGYSRDASHTLTWMSKFEDLKTLSTKYATYNGPLLGQSQKRGEI